MLGVTITLILQLSKNHMRAACISVARHLVTNHSAKLAVLVQLSSNTRQSCEVCGQFVLEVADNVSLGQVQTLNGIRVGELVNVCLVQHIINVAHYRIHRPLTTILTLVQSSINEYLQRWIFIYFVFGCDACWKSRTAYYNKNKHV